jgi:hypothetical protein
MGLMNCIRILMTKLVDDGPNFFVVSIRQALADGLFKTLRLSCQHRADISIRMSLLEGAELSTVIELVV